MCVFSLIIIIIMFIGENVKEQKSKEKSHKYCLPEIATVNIFYFHEFPSSLWRKYCMILDTYIHANEHTSHASVKKCSKPREPLLPCLYLAQAASRSLRSMLPEISDFCFLCICFLNIYIYILSKLFPIHVFYMVIIIVHVSFYTFLRNRFINWRLW